MDHTPSYYYKQFLPAEELSDAIECYWYFFAESHSGTSLQTLIPGGRIEWIFSFQDPLRWLISENDPGVCQYGSFILGQRNRHFFAKPGEATELWGIRFRPGGWGAFSRVPAFGILNTVQKAGEIFAKDITKFERGLRTVPLTDRKIDMLDTELLKCRFSPAEEFAESLHLIDKVRNSSCEKNINELCFNSSIHYKKLERVFLSVVGYAPSTYRCILRFNRMLKKLSSSNLSLTKLALGEGYFDQSHFIREFRRFAGTSPGQFNFRESRISALLIRHQPV